jgi:hypothetical protein
MLHLVELGRTYALETITVMTAAFDTVCRSAPMQVNDDVRRKVARIILRYVDMGERDPVRLSELAFNELTGADRSPAKVTVR